MAEFDTIDVTNPTSEDFEWKYNGEMYRLPAGKTVSLAKYVGQHLAKHLSTKMITQPLQDSITPDMKPEAVNRINVKISQLNTCDTHERRIALYRILRSREGVDKVIQAYPFKGFVGEMGIYEKFVNQEENVPKEVKQDLIQGDSVGQETATPKKGGRPPKNKTKWQETTETKSPEQSAKVQ